ncbi:MAG: exodeoxyribonuclease VII small subunit [Balneolales bacterium]|nr:exodeoxyribonuclease VII small subunit [Balneolales bacterium]
MAKADKDMRFEEALSRLENIVQQLEQSELPLEESVKQFEEGLRLSRYCSKILETAELRVEQIKQSDNQDS